MILLTNPLLVDKKTRSKEVLGFNKQLKNPCGEKVAEECPSYPDLTLHPLPSPPPSSWYLFVTRVEVDS